MIEILVNGIGLDLNAPSVRLEKSFGLEQDTSFQQSYSFPLSLANSAKNINTLGYVSNEKVSSRKKVFDCILKLMGVEYAIAKIKVTGFNADEIRCNLVWGVEAFTIMDSSIRDINLGEDEDILSHGSSLELSLAYYLTSDYKKRICFPTFYAPNWYGDANENNTDFCSIVNFYSPLTTSYVNNTFSDPNKYSFAPMVYLWHVFECMFKQQGYSINGDAWNDPDFRQLVIFSNKNIDKLEDLYHVIATLKNNRYVDNYSGDSNELIQATVISYPDIDADSRYNNSGFSYSIPAAGDYKVTVTIDLKYDLGTYVAFTPPNADEGYVRVYLSGSVASEQLLPVYDGIHSFTFSISASSIDVGNQLTVNIGHTPYGFANFTLQKENTKVEITKAGASNINISERYLKISDYLPDWTCKELLASFKEWANIRFEIDEYKKIVYFRFISEAMNSKAIEITQKVNELPNTVLNEFTGITIGYNFGTSDTYIKDGIRSIPTNGYLGDYVNAPNATFAGQSILYKPTNEVWVSDNNLFWDTNGSLYADIKIGDGALEKRFSFAPMFMGMFEVDGTSIAIPKTGEKSSSTMYSMGEQEYTPRFMFYRGDAVSGYAMATSSTIDKSGSVVGKRSFDLIRRDGIYQTLHAAFYRLLLKGEEVELYLNIKATDINQVDSWVKVMNDYLEYFSKTVSIIADGDLVKARITCLRM